MAAVIYALCALSALACTWLLLRAYAATRTRVLYWSGLCFLGLFVTNALLVVDKLVLTQIDLALPRHLVSLAAMVLLLYGLLYAED